MHFELFTLTMEAPGLSFYLWSPWRCTAIEHKLFEAIAHLPSAPVDRQPDEWRVDIEDTKLWKQAVQNMSRVLKGWQEEAVDSGTEKRSWRWLIEGDVDGNGYDHKGEKAAFWLFLRLSLDRGSPGESEKGEDIDLNGFGVCIWGKEE